MPDVVDQVALARLYGEPLFALPNDLYIPPEALQVFLEAFEGPLDLLLYLIRKQNFNILDIPMARYWRVTPAIGMSRMLKFCLRIRYSSRSSGPSKASRKTSSASGGMYKSVGSVNSGSPYSRAIATRSTTSGSSSAG